MGQGRGEGLACLPVDLLSNRTTGMRHWRYVLFVQQTKNEAAGGGCRPLVDVVKQNVPG